VLKVKIGRVDEEFAQFLSTVVHNMLKLGVVSWIWVDIPYRGRGLAESLIVKNPVDTVGHTFHSRLLMQIEHKKIMNE